MATKPFSFVVEHLGPELGPWSALEYQAISQESNAANCDFILSCVPESLVLSGDLQSIKGAEIKSESVEKLFADRKSSVCLLDPAAEHELAPADGETFDVFLFGGILGG